MRPRVVLALLAVALAVVVLGAVFAGDTRVAGGDRADNAAAVAGETGAEPHDATSPCVLDVRCGGQTITAATGPLVAVDASSTAITILLAAGFVAATSSVWRDRLVADRLFRPPRVVG